MLEVQAGTGAIRALGKVRLNAGEVIGRAAAVGIETEDQPLLRLANVGQPPKRLVHSELARQPDPGMAARQVGQVQQVDGQPVVASGLEPILRLAKRLPILFVNGFQVVGGGVDDNDDLRLAKRGITLGQMPECPGQIRLVMAGDDHDQA